MRGKPTSSFTLPRPVVSSWDTLGTSRRTPGCYAFLVNRKLDIHKSSMASKYNTYRVYTGTEYTEVQQSCNNHQWVMSGLQSKRHLSQDSDLKGTARLRYVPSLLISPGGFALQIILCTPRTPDLIRRNRPPAAFRCGICMCPVRLRHHGRQDDRVCCPSYRVRLPLGRSQEIQGMQLQRQTSPQPLAERPHRTPDPWPAHDILSVVSVVLRQGYA